MHFSIVSYKSDTETRIAAERILGYFEETNRPGLLFLKFNDGIMPQWLSMLPAQDRLKVNPELNNVGFGSGHLAAFTNPAINENSWLWCCNPDLDLTQGWIELAVAQLDKLPNTAALAGTPIQGDQSLPARRPQGCHALRFVLGVFGISLPMRDQDSKDYAVPGPIFAIRKAPGLEPFDKRVFLFFEELILAEKVRRLGLNAEMLDLPPVKHAIGASRSRTNGHLISDFVRAQTIYLSDYLGWPTLLVKALGKVTQARLRISGGV